MECRINNPTKIILALFLVLTLFACATGASTVSDSSVTDTNVYGSTSYTDISLSPTGSTATNIVHNADEYLYISALQPSVTRAVINQNIVLTPIDLRGSAIYLENSTIVNGYDFDYGEGGHSVDNNPYLVSFDTFGDKTVNLTVTGWDGSNTITRTVSVDIKVSYIDDMSVQYEYIGQSNSSVVSVNTTSAESLRYQWYASMTPEVSSSWSSSMFTNGGTSATSTFNSNGLPAGVYYVKVLVGAQGSDNEDSYVTGFKNQTITIVEAVDVAQPTISFSTVPTSDTRLNGSINTNVYLSVATPTTTHGTLSYQWFDNDVPIAGLTGTANQQVAIADTTSSLHEYRILVKNYENDRLLNEVLSEPVYYHSFIRPVINSVQADNKTVIFNINPVVNITASMSDPEDSYLYNWQYNKDMEGAWINFGETNSTSNTVSLDFNTSERGLGTYYIRLHVYGYGGDTWSATTESEALRVNVVGAGVVTVTPLIGDTSTEIELKSSAQEYSSLSWYMSIDNAEYVPMGLHGILEYYTPSKAGLYKFKTIAVIANSSIESEPARVQIYGVPNVSIASPYVLMGDSINLVVENTGFNVTSGVQWKISTDGTTYNNIDTTYLSSVSNRTTAVYSYTPSAGMGGEYFVKATLSYMDERGLPFTQNVSSPTKLYVYEIPTISIAPVVGSTNTDYVMTSTNTNYGTITWTISQNGGAYTPISSALSPASSTFTYRPTEDMNGVYSVRGEINWESPDYTAYTNSINITIYAKPEIPVIQPLATTIESQATIWTLKLQEGYAPIEGDSYSYVWTYSKNDGNPTVFRTTDVPQVTFNTAASGMGAGTYDFTVAVSGIGGTSVSSPVRAYVIGVTSMSVANSTMDYTTLNGLNAVVSGSSSLNVHWYASLTPDITDSWSDEHIENPTSLNAVFGNSNGIPSGNYSFKMILTGAFGTLDTYEDVGIKNVYTNVYRMPIIDSIRVTECADVATKITFDVNAVIDSQATIDSYEWEYSVNGVAWRSMGVFEPSGEFGWLYSQTPSNTTHEVGDYLVRVVLMTSEGYKLISASQDVSIISLSLTAPSITTIQQGAQVSLTVSASNLLPDSTYNYLIQASSDQHEWKNIGSQGTLTSNSPTEVKNIILNDLGTVYLRVHAWNNGEFDYYTYAYPSITVEAPPKFTLTSDKTDGTDAATVTLTVATENAGSTALTWMWQKSVDDGVTWTNLDSQAGTSTTKSDTTSTSNVLTLYRVLGGNGVYNNIASNVVGYMYHPADLQPVTQESGISTSSADKYTIPTKTVMPYEIVDVYSLSSVIGLVVTQHALYLVDASNKNASNPSVVSTWYLPYGTVKTSKYYKGHLMYETTDGRIIVQSIVGSSGFGNSIELRGYTGTVTDYDMSNYNYMVAVRGNGIYTYDVNGDLQWFIQDTTSDSFAMTKVATDNNLEYAILASATNSNILKAYAGESEIITLTLPNNIQKVYTITYDVERVVAVTDVNTAVCTYSLTVDSTGLNTFTWGNYVTFGNILNYPSSVRAGNSYAGALSRTLYVYDSTGAKVGEYPTSDILTATDIAKLTGDFVMTGGANGQVSILQNTGGGWEGMQSVPLQSALRALAMADSANTFFACTATNVFCGIQSEAEESGTVLTTTYYLKVNVIDSLGNAVPNSGVKIVSASGTNLYTTDSNGMVTLEVIPTKTYTISLPNGEDSVVYTADNYALQYVTLRYPSNIPADRLTYGASLRDNRYIDVSFNNANGNPYYISVKITDDKRNIIVEPATQTGDSYSYTFDTSNVPAIKTFVVTIEADPVGNYDNHVYRTYVLDVKTPTQGTINGTTDSFRVQLGEIPLIPDEMDDNWKLIIFGGLIMLIAGLFSYNHSTKGCVIVAIIAAVMTYFGLLPLNGIWVGCLVVLAFLAVYSWAAQNEG